MVVLVSEGAAVTGVAVAGAGVATAQAANCIAIRINSEVINVCLIGFKKVNISASDH